MHIVLKISIKSFVGRKNGSTKNIANNRKVETLRLCDSDRPHRTDARNLRVSITVFTCGLPYNGKNAAKAMTVNDDDGSCRRVFISARCWRAGEIAL